MPGRGKKRSRDSEGSSNGETKRHKIGHCSHSSDEGVVLVLGEGDVGQLGLGEDILERARPTLLSSVEEKVIQVVCGGMHTVCVTVKGEIVTFGCNDEGSLGRDTSEEGSEMLPGKVPLGAKVVQVSAGDSHTAALTDDGRLYIWGNFRDSNGSIGLTLSGIQKVPVEVLHNETIVKVTSGGDHLVCLTDKGEIYTWGCAEQGQLGRVAECFTSRGGRKGLGFILTPAKVKCRRRKTFFSDVWAGQFATYAQEADTGEVFSWGLNNYFQLGFSDMKNRFVPERVGSFSVKKWLKLDGGQHHTVAMDTNGKVYTIGRSEYGRLGLGEDVTTEKSEPTLVPGIPEDCTDIAAGQSVSLALTKSGTVYGWGMGTSQQLGIGNDEDAWVPTKMGGKQLENRSVIMVSSGGQHTVLLAKDKSTS
ncbi:regulator of chromosome condensation-like [Ylistrum balloti]|uniref:regulator of chromosome condensation-like n=1 Tax=Ylistrum balloti TaxID=509963 RepID=UPI002905AF69|nr:regulator of chromosome condensation-like [Ylistrum balloti]